jgi:hypothetical protein
MRNFDGKNHFLKRLGEKKYFFIFAGVLSMARREFRRNGQHSSCAAVHSTNDSQVMIKKLRFN